jgi:hypothetical protein
MRLRSLLIAFACLALVAPLVVAQTTGEISGVVRGTDGAALPGATVTITGPQMPTGRSATTLSDGAFRFKDLPVGTYHLKASLTGMGAFDQDVVVALSITTEVRPVIRATARESIEVTAALPLVDTKSSDVTAVTPKETIEKLPLARTFTGTFQLAPGVADNRSTAPNAGGGRQDNTFLYDGVNITNAFFGDLYQDFSELDIKEVAITRAGVTPEYGRTGGFLVNAVTKSGSNDIHAEARFLYQPASFEARSKDLTLTSQTKRFFPGADVGLPLMRDHLFFYGSANFARQTQEERINNLGGVPDGDNNINEYFGKLTANPTPSILVDGSFRYRGIDATNQDISATVAPSAGDNPKSIDRVIVGSAFWTVNSKLSFEARFNHNENNNSVSPNTFIPFKQTPFNAAAPYLSGSFITTIVTRTGQSFIFAPANSTGQRIGGSDLAQNDQNFFRNEYRLQSSYLANFLGATHDIRAGLTLSENKEDLIRAADGWGTISVVDTATTGTCSPTGNPNGGRPCYRARYTTPGNQLSRGKTYGVFLQDQATWNYLTVNAGVLVNEDYYIPNDTSSFNIISGNYKTPGSAATIPACSIAPAGSAACIYRGRINMPWSKQFQPRFGIAYEIDHKAHDKIYANLARYDNLDNQSIARAAAPVRLGRTDSFINIQTGTVIQDVIRDNNNATKLVIPTMDPTYTDEAVLGYARPLGGGWSAEIYGMYRKTDDIIEDFSANVTPTSAPDFRYGNIPGFRRYRAATVQVRKAYGGNWTMDASYTLSRLDGNWDLDYSTALFYASSYIGDGPGLFPTDPNRQGILIGDRTHVAKLFGTYTLPTKTTLGGYLRFQSGRPWEARGFDPVNGVDLLYLEPAGSRRLSSWTNFDFQITQNIPLGPANLAIGAMFLNVFNTQPALTVNQDWCPSASTACSQFSVINTPPTNVNFGRATTYAPARKVQLTAVITY